MTRRPSEAMIHSFLDSQRSQGLSYPEVGASRNTSPAGYTVDHHRVQLGRGAGDFARAAESLRRWRMFELGWLQLFWPDTPIRAGSTVAVLARTFGLCPSTPAASCTCSKRMHPSEDMDSATERWRNMRSRGKRGSRSSGTPAMTLCGMTFLPFRDRISGWYGPATH